MMQMKVLCPLLLKNPGLIIDAFGELRDQQEQVREDMEVPFFLCISTPHHRQGY